nr:hypothetical protein [Echinothamnion sp.]
MFSILIDNNFVKICLHNQEKIEVYYFRQICDNVNIYRYPICFTSYFNDTDQIFILLSIFIGIQQFCTYHKLYLGKEILRANICNKLQQLYIQS